jgi:prepilin-type N-terminal cleavage/methylation domain-containing protein/prepilin-type processing-associated H-X9-DG protein
MKRRGFTIVELLTVAAVIALLIGLLAPALSGARAGGRGARCKANLRQMAAAAHAYAAVYDAWPAAIRYDNTGGTFKRVAWDWVTTFDNRVLSPGALWQFTTRPGEVQQCPDFEGASTFGGDPHTGYNYNTSFVGGEASFPHTGWEAVRRGVPLHACRRGEQCAMFGDGGWRGGANKFMRAPFNSENLSLSAIYAGGQAFRHRGSTHIAFIDGHVGGTRNHFPGPHASETLLTQIMNYPRNGFLSNDDTMYDPR